MTWRQLAFKNILHNARRYFGYLLSSAMAVTVFFMFASFTLNDHVQHGYMTRNAQSVLTGCQYIIIMFAIFFVLFFHAALIRSRGKEFGLFRVLGMTPGQTWRTVFAESLILGAMALIAGIGLGIVLLKLFLMAMGSILELGNAIPFRIPPASVLETVLLFGIMFVLDGIIIATRTARRTPKTLMLSPRARQRSGRASWWLVLVGIAALALAYYLTVAHSLELTRYVFPILILTAIGTYLLFSQVSVLVLNWVKKRPLPGIPMLVAGRFAHRVKDHARVLTVVTLLCAIVMSGMGSVFGTNSILGQNAVRIDPFAVQLVTPEAKSLSVTEDSIKAALDKAGTPVTSTFSVPVAAVTIQGVSGGNNVGTAKAMGTQVTVVSASNFNRVRQTIWDAEAGLHPYLDTPAAPAKGHAVLFAPYPLVVPQLISSKEMQFNNLHSFQLSLDGQHDERIFNEQMSGVVPDYLLEVSDEDYGAIASQLPAGLKYNVTGLVIPQWKHSLDAVQQIKASMPSVEQKYWTDRITMDRETRQTLGVMMFAGFFVSVLFFLAAGSAIYFRLQSQADTDRRQFLSLRRIGMQHGEIKKVIAAELLLLFFAPVVVAIIHSVFAMMDLQNLLTISGNFWPLFAIIVSIYTAFTAAYFGIAYHRYLKQVAP